jgi:large subunit ribosomal protein L6
MSRIGKLPIAINEKIKVEFNKGVVQVKGPLGTLSQTIANDDINVEVQDNQVIVTRANEDKKVKAAHGLYRSLIRNMVEGVEKGFSKSLVLNGVGYRAKVQGNTLVLDVGFSHPVEFTAPEGISISSSAPTEVEIKGIDKNKVGQFAATVRAVRKPEPYHGYGIRYRNEIILHKEGKKAGK